MEGDVTGVLQGETGKGDDICEKEPLVISKTDAHDSSNYVYTYALKNSSCFGVSADGNAGDGEVS